MAVQRPLRPTLGHAKCPQKITALLELRSDSDISYLSTQAAGTPMYIKVGAAGFILWTDPFTAGISVPCGF